MKLYEMASEYQALMAMVEDGELTQEQIQDTLNAVQLQMTDKLCNCVALIKQLDGYAAMAEAEAARLAKVAQGYTKSSERINDYVRGNLIATGQDKVNLGLFSLTLKKPTQVAVVLDEEKIPATYWKTIPEKKQLDKRELLAALKVGPVDGAAIEDGKRALLIK